MCVCFPVYQGVPDMDITHCMLCFSFQSLGPRSEQHAVEHAKPVVPLPANGAAKNTSVKTKQNAVLHNRDSSLNDTRCDSAVKRTP